MDIKVEAQNQLDKELNDAAISWMKGKLASIQNTKRALEGLEKEVSEFTIEKFAEVRAKNNEASAIPTYYIQNGQSIYR